MLLAVVDAEGCEGYFGFHFQIMGLGVVKFFFVSRALCAHFPMPLVKWKCRVIWAKLANYINGTGIQF